MADAWRPANDLEHRMRDAVQAGDQETFFRVLAEAELVVPVPPDLVDEVLAGRAQPPWPSREEHGRVHVLAFTSAAAMRESFGPAHRHFVTLRFRDAAAGWPDARWWLLVDAGLPIEARLPSWFLTQLVEGDPRPPSAGPLSAPAPAQPAPETAAEEERPAPVVTARHAAGAAKDAPEQPFQPANDVERELLRALAADDEDAFLKALAGAEVLLPVPRDMDYALKPGRAGFPWQTGEVEGHTVIPVFTSPERMRDLIGDAAAGQGPAEHITLPFAAVARYWPDRDWGLAVNGGTPVGAILPGDRLAGLSEWADEVAARRAAEGFEPQNDVERRLVEAAALPDGDAFLKVLAGAQVLVPADPETPWGIRPDDPEFPWRPVPVRGAPAVQVFTSLRWMHEAIGPSRFVMPGFWEVLAGWPDDGWTLVVNPGTPIGTVLTADRIRDLAKAMTPAKATEPVREPAPEPVREPAAAPVADRPEEPAQDWVPARPTEPPAPAEPAAQRAEPLDPPARPEPVEPPEPPFEPGNRIDQELYEAAQAGDTDAFLRVLLAANVLVPIPADAPLELTPTQPEFRWSAAMRDAATVQVFTSLLRLREVMPASRFVYADFRELIRHWPRPDWAMALNPGTRIGASLEGDQVQALSEWATRVGLFRPRPQVPPAPVPPASLGAPAPRRDPRLDDPAETVFDLPPVTDDMPPPGDPTATMVDGPRVDDPLRTTADAVEAAAGGDPTQTVMDPATAEAMAQAAAGPAGPSGRPEQPERPVAGAARRARPQQARPPEQSAGQPAVLQKVVPHGHVGWYLEQGYDRVGGFVHLVSDVAELQTPAQLYEVLGLLYEDSPFSLDDEGVYVIRWPGYCPDLYRIPFGGRTEEEVRSWGEAGWVQERPPFLGTGFAPGSAGSIREYKVDSARLPYGAEMYYLGRDGTERFVAMYDPDRLAWLRPEQEEGDGAAEHEDRAEVGR
ncbi:SseB family protein [Thermomonospora amylolytica]|uniref:SseB family protein n=1 Tax=Thermomonospora amylolytica TaxID=1411117 RepID=UPI001300AEF4|nr:SseB family protein [Thermomonospora amylolytica]